MRLAEPGMAVTVRTADGKELARVAVSGVVDGADFPVVWVCSEEEWAAAHGSGNVPTALPWPAEDVRPAEEQVPA